MSLTGCLLSASCPDTACQHQPFNNRYDTGVQNSLYSNFALKRLLFGFFFFFLTELQIKNRLCGNTSYYLLRAKSCRTYFYIALVLIAGHAAGEERSPAESPAAGMGLPLHPNSSLKPNWSSILGACSETWFCVDLSTLIYFVLLL